MHVLILKNYLTMHVYYVLGLGVSTVHSLYHLILKVGTITPILQIKKWKVEKLSKVIFLSLKITEQGFESKSL